MEIMDRIDGENTFLLDELHSDTDTDISSNYLDYSSDNLCSELSSDEDLKSARIFTAVDVKNTPVPCPRFKFSGIPSVHVQLHKKTSELFGKLLTSKFTRWSATENVSASHIGVLHSKFLGVFLWSVHLHVPLRALLCHPRSSLIPDL
ncbi:uncharacterized protein TNCV_2157531 [Trichonephila clavipes]|nr:uncharacterized protein TNCV_2157531 [Trichonephila clavipes]